MKHIQRWISYKINESVQKLPENLEYQIKKTIKSIKGPLNTNTVVLKSEDDGITYKIELNNDLSIKSINPIDQKNESIINEKLGVKALRLLAGGALLLTLAGGLVSCEPYEEGINKFSYNVGVRYTHYDPTKGDDNKKVNILLPTGDKNYDVDSTLSDKQSGYTSHGMIFNRRITPTEAMVIKYGALSDKERTSNNGLGYDDIHNIYDYEYDDAVIRSTHSTIGGYSPNYGVPDPRKTYHWSSGLDFLKEQGADIDWIIQQADEELENEEWFEDDIPYWEK